MKDLEIHHNIPITLGGVDQDKNKIRLHHEPHLRVHQEQDISSQVIRKWKMKTNHIVVPNEFTEHERLRVLKMYFHNVGNHDSKVVDLQLKSLLWQQSKPVDIHHTHPRHVAIELLENQTEERIRTIVNQRK